VNDLVNELHGLAAVLELQRPVPGEPGDVVGGPADAAVQPWFEPTGDLLDRWFLAHHTYFLLNVHAADELDRAVAQVRAGSSGRAAVTLERVAVLVRGFTAGMVHSGAMPARFYRDVVRPTMAPPAVPMNLTGVMQLEHRRYRSALGRLLEAVPDPFDELTERDPALAAARDAVLEADLLDLERHVLVAAMLVGDDRSLVQKQATTRNATSALREMRHVRGAAYSRLIRFGDHWLGDATNPAAGLSRWRTA
jgi:hypothetical protein